MIRFSALATALLTATTLSNPAQAAGPDGAKLFTQRCGVCHSLTAHTTVGPSLKSVVGRKAAQLPGYNYSSALKRSGLTWNTATIDKYIAAPSKLVPGGKMVVTVPSATDRAAIVAYLATLK